MAETIFNLIAALYQKYNSLTPENDKPAKLTDEAEDTLTLIAGSMISKAINSNLILAGDKKCVASKDYADIIKVCDMLNSYHFCRAVICCLDSLIDNDSLIEQYSFSNYSNGIGEHTFESLNDNSELTDVIIIPRVKSIPNTISIDSNSDKSEKSEKSEKSDTSDKKTRDDNSWYDSINTHLNNIICIDRDKLRGYKIKNAIVSFFDSKDSKDINEKDKKEIQKITMGFSPISNKELNELVKIKEFYDRAKVQNLFDIEMYYSPDELTEKYLNGFSEALEEGLDLYIGPELLGSQELSRTDKIGYNEHFRNKNDNTKGPYLVVTPSYWNEGKNYISVFYKNGKLIGRQYKQNRFERKTDEKRYYENLTDTPREILLIHIPGLGRLVFPICIDLLTTEYRDIMIRELKADYLICPSYSDGTVQFLNESGSARSFGAKVLWLDSCSALRVHTDTPKIIGYVSVPVNKPEDVLQTQAFPIEPKCNGICSEKCMFKLSIQGISTDNNICNEVNINHNNY